MIPWSKRERDGRFSFVGEDFQLEKPSHDGAARHGVVRQRAWVVDSILQLEQGGDVVSGRATKKQKLNSIRLLEAKKIAHDILHYDFGIRDAKLVAAAVGAPAASTYKTLVAQLPSSGKPILVLLPSNTSLNLKRLAKVLGEKKIALASHADAEALTGLQVGGISALALLQKKWSVYIDRRAADLPEIVISAGQRGLQVRLGTSVLIQLLNCKLVDVADETA